jgi:hypothetical protein
LLLQFDMKKEDSSNVHDENRNLNETSYLYGRHAEGEHQQDPETQQSSIRETISSTMCKISDIINDNLILVRYATLSSVLLLSAYSMSQSPLFYRYRKIQDIPVSYFTRRRYLICRLLPFEKKDTAFNNLAPNKTTDVFSPIYLKVRHLSPVSRFLPKSHYEFALQHSPSLHRIHDPNHCIRIQLYGISQYSELKPNLLIKLSQEHTLVRCQLLSTLADTTAIVRLSYWPKSKWWPVDLGTHLVQEGLARTQDTPITGRYGSDQLRHKQNDIGYLSSLSRLEHMAIAKRLGMWSLPTVLSSSKDFVEHVDWSHRATWYQKLYRKLRGIS